MAVKKNINRSQEFSDSVIDTIREPLIALDHDLRVVNASRSFYKFFKVVPEETVGQLIYDLGNKQWDIPKLRELLETILPEKTTFDDYEVEHDFTTIGRRIMLLNARQIQRVSGKEKIILLAIEDITERKQLEDLLTESEERYRRLFETASDGIVLLEKREGKITHANPATEKMLGYNKKESIGHKLQDIGISLDGDDFQTTMQELNKIGILNYDDVPVKTKTGQCIDTDIYLVDRARLVQCNIRDITEHKQTEESIRQSEEKHRAIIENIEDGYYEVDLKGNFTFFNDSMCRILGYSKVELMGMNNRQITDEENTKIVFQAFNKVYNTGEPTKEFDWQLIRKDGTNGYIEQSASLIKDSSGNPIGFRGIIHDITERKEAEFQREVAFESLRESEERYRALFDSSLNLVYIMDFEGRFIDANDASLNRLGYTREEIHSLNFASLLSEDQLPLAFKAIQEIRETGIQSSLIELRLRHKNGSDVYVETHGSVVMSNGIPVAIQAIARDITERKRAEEALRKTEETYRLVVDNMSDVITVIDLNLRFTYVSPSIIRLRGYTVEEVMAQTFEQIMTPESLQIVVRAFEEEMKLEASGAADPDRIRILELEEYRKDGSTVWLENHLSSFRDKENKIAGIISLSHDITERKRAEKTLKESENKYRLLSDNVNDVIFVLDMNLKYTYVSPSTKSLRGYEPEEVMKVSPADTMTPSSWDLVKMTLSEVMEREKIKQVKIDESLTLPLEMKRKDGSTVWTEVKFSFIRDENQQPVGILGVTRDITERRLAEDALRERDIQLKKLTSWVPGMMYQFTKRPDGTYYVPFSTEAVKDIFGCSPEDIREDYSPIARVILPEDLDKVVVSIEYSAKHLTIWTCEYRVQIPGQSIRWVLGKSTPDKLADGSITWYGFNTDITELKKAEEALRKSEEDFRSLAESMPQIVWVTRKDGWNIYFNQQWMDYTGLTLEESYGHGWNTPFHPDDKQRAWDAWQNATKNNGIYSIECRLRRADGVYHWWLVRGVPLLDETGEIIKWFGTCTDIDNIKVAEKQLQDTVESLKKAVGTTIQVLISALEIRDPYTAGHQLRVAHLAGAIATEMGLTQEKVDGIKMAGSIHDIGKLSIPSEILSKPTKLTKIEFSLVKEHVLSGYEMLKDVESPWPLAQIVYQHHERMDGSGYPRNLKGEEIILEARIMAVADVVEAMASHRPYRPSLGIDATLEEIEKNKGILYDDVVAKTCLKLFREKGFQLK